MMTERITKILNVMAPIKTIQVRTKYAPWMSQNTKEKIKERDLAQARAVETKDGNDWAAYKALRNNVNSILRSEKRQ